MNDSAGAYRVRVKTRGQYHCDLPVEVSWLAHKKEPEPFLGFKPSDPVATREALAAYEGKAVEVEFTPADITK